MMSYLRIMTEILRVKGLRVFSNIQCDARSKFLKQCLIKDRKMQINIQLYMYGTLILQLRKTSVT